MFEGQKYETIWIPNMDSAFKIYESHWRKTIVPWWTYQLIFPIFEMNVLLEGVQEVRIGERSYEMHAGDVLIINPGVRRQVVDTRGQPITYFTLHFDVEDYMLRTILSHHRCGLHPRDSALERDIRSPLEQLVYMLKLDRQQDMRHPAIRLKLTSHLFSLFAALGNFEGSEAGQGMDTTGPLIAYRLAEQIELAVKGERSGFRDAKAARGTITLMAERLGYSTSYCYRVFRKLFGMSPQAYMTNIILHQSRLELINTDQSLDQIAEKLGFQDGLHFSKQFKRWTGCSPSAFRRNPMGFRQGNG